MDRNLNVQKAESSVCLNFEYSLINRFLSQDWGGAKRVGGWRLYLLNLLETAPRNNYNSQQKTGQYFILLVVFHLYVCFSVLPSLLFLSVCLFEFSSFLTLPNRKPEKKKDVELSYLSKYQKLYKS